jgi:hypothetical protein
MQQTEVYSTMAIGNLLPFSPLLFGNALLLSLDGIGKMAKERGQVCCLRFSG